MQLKIFLNEDKFEAFCMINIQIIAVTGYLYAHKKFYV